MFSFLRGWWRRKHKPPLAQLHFVLYTRTGCHLCDDAWELLRREQTRYGFQLSSVDVDGDPALKAQYGLEVPVLAVDGKVRFRGLVNRVLLTRLLEAEAAQR